MAVRIGRIAVPGQRLAGQRLPRGGFGAHRFDDRIGRSVAHPAGDDGNGERHRHLHGGA